jgi:hypothetical protein
VGEIISSQGDVEVAVHIAVVESSGLQILNPALDGRENFGAKKPEICVHVVGTCQTNKIELNIWKILVIC